MILPTDPKEILELIQQSLDFDPFDYAEKVIGKEGDDAQKLGFMLLLKSGQVKEKLLKMINDTYWHIPFEDAQKVIEELGFESEYEESFDEENTNSLLLYIHKNLPIVLKLESYQGIDGKVINSLNVFCCLDYSDRNKCKEIERAAFKVHASREAICIYKGGEEIWRDAVAISLDGREALRYKLSKILPHIYVNPWPREPFLWFLNFVEAKVEEKNQDYQKISVEKLKRCKSYERIIGWEA